MKKLFSSFFLFFPMIVWSQFGTSIRAGRPGQAIGPFTVGKNVLQFQQGFENAGSLNNSYNPFSLVNNNVIRYGIGEQLEISTLIDYSYIKEQANSLLNDQIGLSAFHLGFRVHFNGQKGLIPSTCFQMRLKLPWVTEDFKPYNTVPVMIVVNSWKLKHDMSITANWIFTNNDFNSAPVGKYVLNFGFPIYGKWSGFIENYGTVTNGNFYTYFDGGFAYLVNNNIQLDLSGGYGSNNNLENYFVSLGVSWRIVKWRYRLGDVYLEE